jgi:hypothetical protein
LQGQCPYNVALTHTNSHYSLTGLYPYMGIRNHQFKAIRDLIVGTVGEANLRKEPVFLGGDFNIDGNRSDVLGLNNGHPLQWPYLGVSEWAVYFTAEGNTSTPALNLDHFYGCARSGFKAGDPSCLYSAATPRLFTDPGAFGVPAEYLGQTTSDSPHDITVGTDFHFQDGEGYRYDYLLHNQPADDHDVGYLCMQHLRQGRPKDDPSTSQVNEGNPLSDHLPLIVDFNKRAPRCSPVLRSPENADGPTFGAVQVPSTGFEYNDSDTKITWPGSVQWYRLTMEGTLAIATAGQVKFEVYKASDLATPVDSFHKQINNWVGNDNRTIFKGSVYVLDDGPYLVKVFRAMSIDPNVPNSGVPDLAGTGAYVISFHVPKCSSMKDACPLKAGFTSNVVDWPDTPIIPVNGEYYSDKMYFTFSTLRTSTLSPKRWFEFVRSDQSIQPTLLDETGMRIFEKSSYDPTLPDCAPGTPPPCNLDRSAIVGSPPDEYTDNMYRMEVEMQSGHPYPPQVDTPTNYVLRIGRDPNALALTTMYIRYLTDLQRFRPASLICSMQEDIWGDDDAYMDIIVNPADEPSSCSMTHYLGAMDSDETPLDLTSRGMDTYFTESIAPVLCEYDLLDPNDLLSPGDWNNTYGWYIDRPALLMSETTSGEFYWGSAEEYDDSDYWYSMDYYIDREDLSK